MENPSEKIYSILRELTTNLGVKDVEFSLMRPKDKLHGDLASNIALVLFKNKGPVSGFPPASARSSLKRSNELRAVGSLSTRATLQNPLQLAEELVKKIKQLNIDTFEKVEAVKPGFINFHFSKKYLFSQVQSIISQGSNYGSSGIGKGKKASVEFVSANPTGPLHIGNARGGPLGDTIFA